MASTPGSTPGSTTPTQSVSTAPRTLTSPTSPVAALQELVSQSVQTAVSASFDSLMSTLDARIRAALGTTPPSSTPPSSLPPVVSTQPASVPAGSSSSGPVNICLPPASVLAGLGLQSGTLPTSSSGRPIMAIGTTPHLGASAAATSTSIVVAAGLPAIRKALVDAILSDQYVDFTELPPAKGRTKAIASHLEGQVVLLQTSDYLQAKRLTPDLGTWLQCFAIYTAVVLTKFPERATSLMLYAANIAKLSQKFRWPSWVIYDNSFRQEAAEARHTDWTKIDGSLHAQCFHGMSITSESWCTLCHSVDHLKNSCPLKPRDLPPTKRSAPPQTPAGGAKRFREAATPICGSYNKNNGDCSFMPRCNYRHVCRRCHGPHPEPKCGKASAQEPAP